MTACPKASSRCCRFIAPSCSRSRSALTPPKPCRDWSASLGCCRFGAVTIPVTLDGNEQFADMATFRRFMQALQRTPALSFLLSRVLWIEQPVTRDMALDAAAAPDLAELKPVIIDESDDHAMALERALQLGYAGVSSKLCKGVFSSVAHFVRLQQAREQGRHGLVLSSEDLTTVPIHPLQQDMALAAALGITHSERNGHHYVRGFEFMTMTERKTALGEYPSLYGSTGVRIANGAFDVAEVNAAPGFGSACFPDWSAMQVIQ